ncbi:MAG TPA: hypothetical protein DCE78_08200 [Bacteroidetes bacterium]|nr:hypothetical protein [Bacteroidota bacterium]
MVKRFLISALTVLSICAILVAPIYAQSDSTDTNASMQKAIAQNLWDDVLLIASDMLIENPNVGDGYYYTALAFYRLGDVEKAREYLAFTEDFDEESLQTLVAEIHEEMNYNESLEQAASQIGSIQQSGNAAVAADEWQELWTQDKSQVDFALNAVQLFVQQKRYLEALEVLGDPTLRTVSEANQAIRAINSTPEMVAHYAYNNAMRDGGIALSGGNYQQAISQFNTALRVRPNDVDATRFKRESEDELAWETAKAVNSIDSYDVYVSGNTNKKYLAEAKSIIRDGLFFHGRNNAENDNVQLAEYNLNRFASEYPTDPSVAESRNLLCSMYIRIGDRNSSGTTVGAQRTAVDYYTRAQNVCDTDGGLGSKITRSNRKATNWARPSQAFMAFTYDDLSTYGLTIGNLHTRGAGFYLTARANEALFNASDLYTVDDNGNLDGANSSYSYRDAGGRQIINGEGLIGLTYEIGYPLWLFAGAGVAYNAEQWEIDEYLRGDFYETQWIRNTDQSNYEPVFEIGAILNFSGFHLQAGIKGYDAERTFITLGGGFSF